MTRYGGPDGGMTGTAVPGCVPGSCLAPGCVWLLCHRPTALETVMAWDAASGAWPGVAVPLDRCVLVYDAWVGAVASLHPGLGVGGYALTARECADPMLLERLLLPVIFDGQGHGYVRSVVRMVNGYRLRRAAGCRGVTGGGRG